MYNPKMTKKELQEFAQHQENIIDNFIMFVTQLGLNDIYKKAMVEGETIDISEVKEVIKNLKCPNCHPKCECCGGYKSE